MLAQAIVSAIVSATRSNDCFCPAQAIDADALAHAAAPEVSADATLAPAAESAGAAKGRESKGTAEPSLVDNARELRRQLQVMQRIISRKPSDNNAARPGGPRPMEGRRA